MFNDDEYLRLTDNDDDRFPLDYFSNYILGSNTLTPFNQDDKDKNKTIKVPQKRGRKGEKGTREIHDKYKDDNIIKGCISFVLCIIYSFFCAQLEKDIKKKIQAISSQIQKTSKNAYSVLLKKKLKDLLSEHKNKKTAENKNKSIIDSLANNEKYKDFLDMTFEDFLKAISPSIRLEPENSSYSTRATTGNKDNGIELDEEKEDNIIESIKNGLSKRLTKHLKTHDDEYKNKFVDKLKKLSDAINKIKEKKLKKKKKILFKITKF